MKFKIAWLYYDILNLYGDSGNILVLEKILKDNNIDYVVDKLTLNDNYDLSNHDLLFIGGGSDLAQQLIYQDLISKKEQIIKLMENNGFILTVCGGYQLFGKEYIDANNNVITGLGIFDYTTKAGNKRLNDNIYIKAQLGEEVFDIVGYENHGGNTFGVSTPLGQVVSGCGNNEVDKTEGFIANNFIGTYIHGPLLPKNPEIAKYIITKVFKDKYNQDIDLKITSKYYQLAKEVIKKRLTK